MAIRTLIASVWLTLGVAATVLGQTSLEVRPAELAVPFGSAPGKLLLVGDQIVFVDDQQVDASFAIARNNIRSLEEDGGMVTVTTITPVKDRSGERSVLRFRLSDTAVLERWHSATQAAATPVAAPAPDARSLVREARHNHRLGGCQGRLIITDTRLAFESVDEIGDSRQWVYRDIREVKQDGPYKLEVRPFVGNTYDLELLGQGLDSGEFRMLVDRITSARVR